MYKYNPLTSQLDIVNPSSGGAGGPILWGDITGDITDQADLQAALASAGTDVKAIKEPVWIATNAELSSLEGLADIPTVNGPREVADGTRVLVTAQSDATTNGIYTAHIGAWTRSSDADSSADFTNAFLVVTQEDDIAYVFQPSNPSSPFVLGTNSITFVQAFAKTVHTHPVGDITGLPTIPTTLPDLDDVSYIDGLDDGDVLTYNTAESVWYATAPNTPSLDLDDLGDVNTFAVSTGDLLQKTSGGWGVTSYPVAEDVGAAPSTYALGRVDHGSTAGTARPTGYYSIQWVGSVEPTNATANDTWLDTT
jgi:hypothetical protein